MGSPKFNSCLPDRKTLKTETTLPSGILERDDDHLLTPEDVARLFAVPRSWVYGSIRGRSRDKLPHIYIGRYPRFEEAAVREFLARRRRSYPKE